MTNHTDQDDALAVLLNSAPLDSEEIDRFATDAERDELARIERELLRAVDALIVAVSCRQRIHTLISARVPF